MMNNTPIISVVMPVYKSEQYLTQSIESILDQTFKDFELIIVSEDTSELSHEIFDHFQKTDTRIQIYHETGIGLIESLNRGCKIAAGKYIIRMDADDICLSDRFEKQVDFMEKHPEIGVSGCWVNYIDCNGRYLGELILPTLPLVVFYHFFFYCPLAHPTACIRREILEKAGFYDLNSQFDEDYNLWLRILKISHITNIPYKLLNYRIHGFSVSNVNKKIQQRNFIRDNGLLIRALLQDRLPEKVLSEYLEWRSIYKIKNKNSVSGLEKMIFKIFKEFIKQNTPTCDQELTEIKIFTQSILLELVQASLFLTPNKAIVILYKIVKFSPKSSIPAFRLFLKAKSRNWVTKL